MQQRQLTAHLRAPDHVPPPEGLDQRRLAIYQRLVFNNLLGLLGTAFPVCQQLLGETVWQALIRAYLANQRCRTPLFTALPAEFVQWLQAHPGLPHPALAELAHYEWVETALYQMEAKALPNSDGTDPLDRPLQRSALAWPLLYRWPVHQLGSADAPTQLPAEPTCLLVRRDADGVVRFSKLSVLAFHLLASMDKGTPRTGQSLLQALARQHGLALSSLLGHGTTLLQQLQQTGVIGTVPPQRSATQ